MSSCGMSAGLSGVPKPALQTVFGKALGRRIWRQGRGGGTKATREASTVKAAASRRAPRYARIRSGLRACLGWMRSDSATTMRPVTDSEIVAGMIEYLASQAGETLGRKGRQAKAIGLRIVYADGVSRIERTRLARPTNDGPEIHLAAMALFAGSEERGVAVASVNLTATSVQAECVAVHDDGLQHAMARTVAAGA
jgi:impB/mucB/samB family protein